MTGRPSTTLAGRRRAVGLLAVVPLLALPLASCSGQSQSAARDTRSFTFAIQASPQTLDVGKNDLAQPAIGLVYDLLERLGTNGSLTPGLAASVSTPDATTIVYRLRPNVRFSNGDPLTAADVAWSLEHDYGSGSLGSAVLKTLKDATPSGPNEVTVHLTQPDPTARQVLAFEGYVYDAAQARAHPKDFGTPAAIPAGTGPYRVAKWTSDTLTLDRNGAYWGTRPTLDEFRFVDIEQDSTAQLAMRSGSVQAAGVGNPVTVSQWRSIPRATVYSVPTPQVIYLSLDTQNPPFNDIHLRKAIAYAVDRAGLAQAIYHGDATVASSIEPPSGVSNVAPSPAAAHAFFDGLPQYGFDLAKARAELALSAYPHGLTVTLPYLTGQAWADLTAQNLQRTLREIGVNLELRPLASGPWATQFSAHKDLGMQLNSGGGVVSWDPSGWLALLTDKAAAAPDGINTANYFPPDVEASLSTLTGSSDKAARWQATTTMLTRMAADVPYVPLFNAPYLYVLGGGFRFAGPVDEFFTYNGTLAFSLR